MDDTNQPVENQAENQNPPENFRSQLLAITNAKWFLVGVVLFACAVLYAISASSRGLWPFPAPEVKVVMTPSPSATFTPLPDPTASWQTYRNEEYGFEVKYLSGWNPQNLEVRGPLNGYKYENPPAGTSFIYNMQQNTWSPKEYAPIPEITTNGIKWFLAGTVDGLGGASIALIPNGRTNTMINIWYGWGTCLEEYGPCPKNNNPSKEAEEKLFEIISTFKFMELPPVPTDRSIACIQVITPARNLQTGEVKDFPTPCDVPEGWEVIK